MAVRHVSLWCGGFLASDSKNLAAAAVLAACCWSGIPLAAAPWAGPAAGPTPSVLVRPTASSRLPYTGSFESAPESAAGIAAGLPIADPEPVTLPGGSWEAGGSAPVQIVQEPVREAAGPGVLIDDGEPLPLSGCGPDCPENCQACGGAGSFNALCQPRGFLQEICDAHACSNVCWTLRADALILFRNAPAPRPIYDYVNPPNIAAIDANQLNSPAAGGGRLSLFRREACGNAWEATYLYGGQFFATRSTPFLASGYLTSAPGIFGNDYPPINFLDSTSAQLTASIQTAEINRRWWASQNCQLLAGFRWLQWYEAATISDTYGTGSPSAGSDVYTNTCINNLFGGQLGIDSLLYRSSHGFRLEGLVKAGAYGNAAAQSSSYVNFVNGAPFYSNAVGVKQNAASCSFVGEVGLTGVVPLCCNWDFRFGYVGLWVTGLAQPMRQLGGQSLAPGEPTSGTLSAVGTAVVQGASLGLEGRW